MVSGLFCYNLKKLREGKETIGVVGIVVFVSIAVIIGSVLTISITRENRYREMEAEILKKLGFSSWDIVPYYDEFVIVKSRQALEKYDEIKFFKENDKNLANAQKTIERKNEILKTAREFLNDNEYKDCPQYSRIVSHIDKIICNASFYRVAVKYISSAGNHLGTRGIALRKRDISRFEEDPSLLMGKAEYNKYLKERQKEALEQKQHAYYEKINRVIDFANEKKSALFIKGSKEQLDSLIAQLFDRTVNSIKKIKTVDSEEWNVVGSFIDKINKEINEVVDKNERILRNKFI